MAHISDKQKFNLLKGIMNDYNELHGGNYEIEDFGGGTIEIRSNANNFSGCFIKNLAALADVYNWSFGIHTDQYRIAPKGHLYILI